MVYKDDFRTLRDFINKMENLNGILENPLRKTKNRKIILKIKREREVCFFKRKTFTGRNMNIEF